MGNVIRNQFDRLKQSQRGAALLMVLLVTVFVVLTGSSVMFTSYNGYIMNLVDREGVDTFYSTEDALDLVRANVQDVASDALQTAYTRVMAEYAFIQADAGYVDTAVQVAAQAKFNQYFIEELAKGTYPSSSSTENLFLVKDSAGTVYDGTAGGLSMGTGSTITGYMSTEALESVLSNALSGVLGTNDKVTVDGSTDASYNATTSAGGTNYFNNGSGELGQVAEFYFSYGDDGYPRLVIENVCVSYVVDGFQTSITTDIVIEMPMFIHTGDITTSNYQGGSSGNESSLGLPFDNASSIGKYWVKFSNPNHVDGLLVTGDIYGGTFFIYRDENSTTVDPTNIVFSHGEGRLITNNGVVPVLNAESGFVYSTGVNLGSAYTGLDGIAVYGGTSFTSESTSEIWTNALTAYEGSDIRVAGERGTTYNPYGDTKPFGGTFVAKDFMTYGGIIKGVIDSAGFSANVTNPANITISGDYYGFGIGDTADSASAIVLNGTDINLNMDGARDLVLGGTTYLQIGRDSGTDLDDGSEYAMGQSIAALPDQLAYMVPYEALSLDGVTFTSNPMEISNSGSLNLSNTKVLTDKLDSSISSYVTNTPKVISRTYGDTSIVYFYFQFDDDADRAAYIQNYIANFDSVFENNLDLFVNFGSGTSSTVNASGSGVIYYTDSKGDLVVVNDESSTSRDTTLKGYADYFENAAITLWPDIAKHKSVPPTVTGTNGQEYGYPIYNLNLNTEAEQDSTTGSYKLVGNIGFADLDNPFDYYVNMRGDNLVVDMAYTHDGGYNFAKTTTNVSREGVNGWNQYGDVTLYRSEAKVAGISSSLGGYPDLYSYYDHDGDKVYNPTYVNYLDLYSTFTPYKSNTKNTLNGLTELYSDLGTGKDFLRIGLADWATNEYGGDTNWVYEFKTNVEVENDDGTTTIVEDAVVAIYKANGITWGDHGITRENYPYVTMLLSRAGINIYKDFKGLAFSETGIAIIGKLDSVDDGFESVLNAYCENPDTHEIKYLYEFFRNLDLTQSGGSDDGDPDLDATPGVSEDDAKVNWSPNDLVYYENWERH